MASLPKDAIRCGCGLVGSEIVVFNRRIRGQRLVEVHGSENSHVHQMVMQWCTDCRQSEFWCLDFQMGRVCNGLFVDRGNMTEPSLSGFFPFSG